MVTFGANIRNVFGILSTKFEQLYITGSQSDTRRSGIYQSQGLKGTDIFNREIESTISDSTSKPRDSFPNILKRIVPSYFTNRVVFYTLDSMLPTYIPFVIKIALAQYITQALQPVILANLNLKKNEKTDKSGAPMPSYLDYLFQSLSTIVQHVTKDIITQYICNLATLAALLGGGAKKSFKDGCQQAYQLYWSDPSKFSDIFCYSFALKILRGLRDTLPRGAYDGIIMYTVKLICEKDVTSFVSMATSRLFKDSGIECYHLGLIAKELLSSHYGTPFTNRVVTFVTILHFIHEFNPTLAINLAISYAPYIFSSVLFKN